MTAYLLEVTGNDNLIYRYGVFHSRIDADRFAKQDCPGFDYVIHEIIIVERDPETDGTAKLDWTSVEV